MNNQPVNPLTIESPPCDPVRPELLDSFRTVQQLVMQELDSLRVINGGGGCSGGCER